MSISFYVTDNFDSIQEDPSLHLSNASAFRLLEALGFDGDEYCGILDPINVLDSIRTLSRRLEALTTLCQVAKEREKTITFA